MPKYWLISDRNNNGTGQGMNTAGLTYWVSDGDDLTSISSWQKMRNAKAFQTVLANTADQFPANVPNEQQSHVTILVHGFNVNFQHATGFYQKLCDKLVYRPGFFERPVHLI